ncbi:hypothetical protein U8527_11905 [Kordia algicida OT-1]|uniref:Uncharacterized protein n=1 Tax=Kordia algicida OT-1 TaxID=391587 RepID=A9E0B5_9FLAO|nr:hypothetical protein [Kordia algicida]EDP95822.1 hypothetical protein KAOT1_05442 [Kordia algicida OT-1]
MKTTHTKQNKELINQKLKQQTLARKKLILHSIVIFFIAISPFIAYLYLIVPTEDTWDTGFFIITKNGFSNTFIAVWIYVSKFVPLYLLMFWFITCKHWWYHIILIPITMYAFQLFSSLNKEAKFIDENEIFWVLIVMLILTPIVYLIRLKLFDKLVLGIDLKKIEAELDEYERKEKEAENKIEV